MSELPQPPAYDPEAAYIRGIPYPLPKGERILWQGGPDFFLVASRVLKVPAVAAYFGILVAVQGVLVARSRGLPAAVDVMLPLTLAGLVVTLYGVFYAWLTARASWFAITSRRVVMRVGVALTVTVNIPLRVIASADVRTAPDGSGDLAFPVVPEERLSLFQLWPYWRPWNVNRPVPQLRALPKVAEAAAALKSALVEG